MTVSNDMEKNSLEDHYTGKGSRKSDEIIPRDEIGEGGHAILHKCNRASTHLLNTPNYKNAILSKSMLERGGCRGSP